jgi:hypothetical protein
MLHGFSHVEHGVPLDSWQWAYVIFVVFLAPVVAATLLWTRLRWVGAWLLLASMAGSLVFGLAFHFLISGPDNVLTLNPEAGRQAFSASAVLVALTEAIGCIVGAWAFSKLPRSAEGAVSLIHPRSSCGEEVR